ncbi:hypothetical protein GDO78_018898 [Eleutherodactylus coqui]|uniref:Uncharacterized protein n=1 Tax=Eleutherodactylus coqui TaxID=57060 RepID=A0A8J6EJI9_ELECQ|nr:hypothetical protein GDO78_018898 [Eleutherodactylus coqui]
MRCRISWCYIKIILLCARRYPAQVRRSQVPIFQTDVHHIFSCYLHRALRVTSAPIIQWSFMFGAHQEISNLNAINR